MQLLRNAASCKNLKPIFFNFYGNRLRNSEGKPHRRPAK